MTPEQQRIAIAEACGWTDIEKEEWVQNSAGGWTGMHPQKQICLLLPDYLNDLNAMHEAEKTLSDSKIDEYKHRLRVVITASERISVCATAAQRAECFLRTIGKWADQPQQSPGKYVPFERLKKHTQDMIDAGIIPPAQQSPGGSALQSDTCKHGTPFRYECDECLTELARPEAPEISVCQCIDCGGNENQHSSDCNYMAEITDEKPQPPAPGETPTP